jgi:hypothetical protein
MVTNLKIRGPRNDGQSIGLLKFRGLSLGPSYLGEQVIGSEDGD